MVIMVLLIVSLFLWFLSLIPVAQVSTYAWASGWLAWIVALLLTLFLFVPGLR